MKLILPLLLAAFLIFDTAAAQDVTSTPEAPLKEEQPAVPIQLAKKQSADPTPPRAPSNPRFVNKKEPVRVPRFSAPPIIDGQIDDLIWQDAAVFGDFLQTQPGDNVSP